MKLMESKTCTCCGKKHDEIPASAREGKEDRGEFPGWYFECSCGSTLFVAIYLD